MQAQSSFHTNTKAIQEEKIGEGNLANAAGAVRVAMETIRKIIPEKYLKESLLANGRTMSTSCTGVYTGEVAMGIVQKTWNRFCDLFHVNIQPESCHDPWTNLFFFYVRQESRRRFCNKLYTYFIYIYIYYTNNS